MIRSVDEVEERPISFLTFRGKKVKVKNVNIRWLTEKGLGGFDHNFAVRYITIGSGGLIPMHGHEYVEAMFILKGKIEIKSGGEEKILVPNMLCYVPSNEPHELRNIGNETASFTCSINCIGNGENCIPK